MKWTKEQLEAINYRGENILLAAAAGSGKTAVLVQRIIGLISPYGEDGKTNESPLNINELLVLTFTDAAAREMREKISLAVSRALREHPENEHLKKQSLYLHSASISTIHSFCMNVLRSNIHLTKLPVDFTLGSDIENRLMLKEAVDGVLERYYKNIDRLTSFKSLALGYGGIKNDKNLRELVFSVFDFIKSMAYPSRWINDAVDMYREVSESKTLDGSLWHRELLRLVSDEISEILEMYGFIRREIDEKLLLDHPYAAFFEAEAQYLRQHFDGIGEMSYGDMRRTLISAEFSRMVSGVRGADGELKEAQDLIKKRRENAKKAMKALAASLPDEETAVYRIEKTYPIIKTLKNIVLMTDRSYRKKKLRKKCLDFNDLEHETLKLLSDSSGNPKEAAALLGEKYKEILVDEYQDTNNVQDTVFRLISGGRGNIFMVGDLKQCIYKFRNAVPMLFFEKYQSYKEPDGGGHLIKLFKNFRSRESVINTVNFVFSAIMSEGAGELDYTEEEYLTFGADYYPGITPKEQFDTELHMLHYGGTDVSAEESDSYDNEADEAQPDEPDRIEAEAHAAAMRIKEIISGEITVYDKAMESCRRAELRDIVILMRNTKGTAQVFEKVLSQYGIGVYTDAGKSYLTSREVETVLAALAVIDNPRQDIPLIAAMRSPIWHFSADELAEIRTISRKGCFWEAVLKAAEEGSPRIADFIRDISDFREKAEYMGVDKLIHSIYYEYGYYPSVGALDRGIERQANLRLLYERAADFERQGMSGLFNFINYIEAIKAQGGDLTPAKVFSEDENVVRIMSIHKSKGLEFPVCILADTARAFNMSDLKPVILKHDELGIGADYVDTDLRIRYPGAARTVIRKKSEKELISEEMRLLYVALTRTREKLIILAAYKDKDMDSLRRDIAFTEDKRVALSFIRKHKRFRDWLLAAFLLHSDARELRAALDINESLAAKEGGFSLKLYMHDTADSLFTKIESASAKTDAEGSGTKVGADNIRKRLMYEYPKRELGDIPVKMSVSEVKRIQADEGEYFPVIEELKFSALAELDMISGAERGSVVHFVMQAAEADKINSENDVRELVEELVIGGVMTRRQADAVNCAKVFGFFESDLGRRLKKADEVEKEFSFYTEAAADEIFGNGMKEKILLQGTVDCFFTEGDKLILLDFKTDNVKTKAAAELRAKNYRTQMKYYKKGLFDVLEKTVDECYLYFLECGETIKM